MLIKQNVKAWVFNFICWQIVHIHTHEQTFNEYNASNTLVLQCIPRILDRFESFNFLPVFSSWFDNIFDCYLFCICCTHTRASLKQNLNRHTQTHTHTWRWNTNIWAGSALAYAFCSIFSDFIGFSYCLSHCYALHLGKCFGLTLSICRVLDPVHQLTALFLSKIKNQNCDRSLFASHRCQRDFRSTKNTTFYIRSGWSAAIDQSSWIKFR